MHTCFLVVVLQALKRKNIVSHLVDASNAFSEQKKVLPEDRSMIGLPFLTSLHKSLDYDWDSKTNHTAIMQVKYIIIFYFLLVTFSLISTIISLILLGKRILAFDFQWNFQTI